MNENTEQVSKFVFRRLTETFPLFGREVDGWPFWAIVLGVVLFVGLVYVVWMYMRDGRTIGWFWGTFLALLRLAVYALLAVVFLLPARQNWENTTTLSRVVTGYDVSPSMRETRDDLPTEGVAFEQMPTRQDKVVRLLADNDLAFLKKLQERNPVFAYRWGLGVDEDFKVLSGGSVWDRKDWEEAARVKAADRPKGRSLTREEVAAWLKPALTEAAPADATEEAKKEFEDRQGKLRRLFSGTNVGESALGVLTREINGMVQGVVLFTDGRSTQAAPQAFRDVAERARRANIPVFVVAVGEDRPPVRIEIADARGPDAARPEDAFPVTVDVNGEGLANREVTVFLDVYRPGARPGKDQPLTTKEQRVTFKPGQPPRAQAEFPFTPEEFGEVPARPEEKPGDKPSDKPEPLAGKPSSGKKEMAEGDWQFVARVPKDRMEVFAGKEHSREPVTVKVVKRPMRVLLFASAATRDYQFVRSMLVREFDKRRVELSIYLQGLPGQVRRTGLVQDVPPERMLTRFPDRLDTNDTEDRVYNLANYDVILAFDPDWSELSKEQTGLVEQWVSQQGGGLVLVAGPIHTLEMARPGASGLRAGTDPGSLKPILDLYPVVLKDKRLEKERGTNDPVRLKFPRADPEMEFLRVDEENAKANPLDAWNEFFMGEKGGDRPVRGFYDFYPVQKTKEGCITVATFSDPQDATSGDQPYLVIQPNYGRGRVVWLGSGESWRLRQYRELWHERFWTKLARYASQGSVGQSTRRIIPNLGWTFPAGRFVEVQAQMFGKDLKPLAPTLRPTITLKLPTGVSDKEIPLTYDMTPRVAPGEWEGWFTGRFLVKSPGEYGLEFRLPDSNEVSANKFTVVEVNPELENTRPDLAAAYELASEAKAVLERVDPGVRERLTQALSRYRMAGSTGDRPLSAPAPATEGDKPAGEKDALRLVFDLKTAELIPECMLQNRKTAQNRGPVEDLWDGGWTLWTENQGTENERPVRFSYVLAAVVGLLSIEWLTRKLLRLA